MSWGALFSWFIQTSASTNKSIRKKGWQRVGLKWGNYTRTRKSILQRHAVPSRSQPPLNKIMINPYYIKNSETPERTYHKKVAKDFPQGTLPYYNHLFPLISIWVVPKIGGSPKSSILIGFFHYFHHLFLGYPIFGNTHMQGGPPGSSEKTSPQGSPMYCKAT